MHASQQGPAPGWSACVQSLFGVGCAGARTCSVAARAEVVATVGPLYVGVVECVGGPQKGLCSRLLLRPAPVSQPAPCCRRPTAHRQVPCPRPHATMYWCPVLSWCHRGRLRRLSGRPPCYCLAALRAPMGLVWPRSTGAPIASATDTSHAEQPVHNPDVRSTRFLPGMKISSCPHEIQGR